jgi:hypothetical protein
MTMNRKTTTITAALFALGCLLLAGCSQMEPAQQALAGVETALNAAGDQAAKYIPEQYAKVKASVDELKKSFDAKDYKAVLANAPAVLSAAKELGTTAAAKKDEAVKMATAEWTSLTAAVPGLIAAVQSRVNVLGNSKHPPSGVDLNTAKASLSEATAGWSKAQSAATAGSIDDAAALGRAAKDSATTAAAALKLKLPGA